MNNTDTGKIFEPLVLKNITIKNRLIRAATYEGCADYAGFPKKELLDIYSALSLGGIGAIITGFTFISQSGRAMQPRQCGIDHDNKIKAWKNIIHPFKEKYPSTAIFMQLAHTGRQTRTEISQFPVLGVSSKKCTYFRGKVHILTEEEILNIIEQFGAAARRAQIIGFDGVQIHAAHGYLIHQFLSSWTNTRKDCWADKNLFLTKVIQAIQLSCGNDYPILIKLSAEDDNIPGVRITDTINTVKLLGSLGVDAVEISYGTMEYAFNIIRGAWPIEEALKINPLFNKTNKLALRLWKLFFLKKYLKILKPFCPNYNVACAKMIKGKVSDLPVIVTGGIRTLSGMLSILNLAQADAISLARPLINDQELPIKIKKDIFSNSSCVNCNLCTIYCDSDRMTYCYFKKKQVKYE